MHATPQRVLAAYENVLASYDWEQIARSFSRMPAFCFPPVVTMANRLSVRRCAAFSRGSAMSDIALARCIGGYIGADIACASYRLD